MSWTMVITETAGLQKECPKGTGTHTRSTKNHKISTPTVVNTDAVPPLVAKHHGTSRACIYIHHEYYQNSTWQKNLHNVLQEPYSEWLRVAEHNFHSLKRKYIIVCGSHQYGDCVVCKAHCKTTFFTVLLYIEC